MMEQFDACWEDVNMPYLVGKRDIINPDADAYDKLDLTEENDAKQWIQSNPPAFCNTSNYRVLSNILNAYDTETMDFYRWELTYKQAELAELINKKTKIDFGEIIDLVPVKRGKSGRIYMLKIVGTERSFTIGKELENAERGRLGTWSRTLPNRCSCDGGEWIWISGNLVTLLSWSTDYSYL